MTNDVFICYSPEDESTATDICNLLEDKNYSCWIKHRDLAEDDTVYAVSEAIRDSKSVILVYSKDAKTSNFVTTEIDIAFSESIPILIFSVDDSAIEGKLQFYLKDKPKIDAYPNAKEFYDKLASDITQLLGDSDIKPVHENNVFICSCEEDELAAQAICHVLEENGIKCWLKKRDLNVSDTVEKVTNSIKESESFVLVYSKDTVNSNYVNTELDLAKSSEIPILLFKIDDVEKPDELKDLHWLDAYPNPEEEFKNLVKDTAKLIDKPIDEPKVSKKYNLKKSPKKDSKKSEVKPKVQVEKPEDLKKNYGFSKKSILIIGAVLLIAVVALVGSFFYIGFGGDVNYNVPEGFVENTTVGYTEKDGSAMLSYKFYDNAETQEWFGILINTNTQGGVGLSPQPGYVSKTINGIDGLYKEADGMYSFMYTENGKMISIDSGSIKTIEEVLPH